MILSLQPYRLHGNGQESADGEIQSLWCEYYKTFIRKISSDEHSVSRELIAGEIMEAVLEEYHEGAVLYNISRIIRPQPKEIFVRSFQERKILTPSIADFLAIDYHRLVSAPG
jgi:hypothetical protein